VSQPASVERFVGTNFTWYGGGPGAEWRPGEAIATLQRFDDGVWTEVASDLDQVIPLRYGKRYGRHRYAALFDPVADQPVGLYRFVVTGAYATAPTVTSPYSLVSQTFEVSASGGLRLVQADGLVTVEHPEPDRLRNYRWRARSPESWSLTGTLNGSPFSASAPFSLGTGDVLSVPSAGIVDANGNTNSNEVTITGAAP
jgi:hypothetical protein